MFQWIVLGSTVWLARVRFVLVSTRLPFPTIDKLLTLSHEPVAKAACLNITEKC